MDKSRAFSKIVNRIKSNAYKTNKNQKEANRAFLTKTKTRLTQKKSPNIKYKQGHKLKLDKINAILEELGSPNSTGHPGSLKEASVGINETLSQGDCLYSSLFRALAERDLLKTVSLGLNIRGSTEVRFVISLRKKIAEEILANRLPRDLNQHGQEEDTYDFFSGLGPLIKDIINGDAGEIFPDWFKREFKNGVGTRANFLRKTAKWVKKRKEYAGELEIAIVKRLFKEIGIIIEIDGTTKETLPLYKNDLPLITLFNEYGGHYEYYSFNLKCPRGKFRNLETRKCMNKPKKSVKKITKVKSAKSANKANTANTE